MGLDSRDYYRPSGMGGFSFFPPVLKKLLIINAVVFLIQMMGKMIYVSGPVTLNDLITRYFALIPLGDVAVGVFDQSGRLVGSMSAAFYPWQLVTYLFLHAGFMHILFNMLFLWMFGMEIENIMGSRKFLTFYLVSGIGAGLFQLLVAPLLGEVGPTLGASGAVYGVMIAFAMFFPNRYIFVYFLLPIKAKYLITILFIIEFMSVGDQSIVAHLAHIGGAVTAFVFVLIDRKHQFNFNNLMRNFKKPKSQNFNHTFRRRQIL